MRLPLSANRTERYWIITGEWPDGHSPDVCRISAPDTVDDADRLAENLLSAGCVRVTVEPFRRIVR